MVKRVIVAFDGSELAREAFAFGLAIAKAAKSELIVVRAIEPPMVPPVLPDPALALGDVLVDTGAMEAEVEAQREEAARELPELAVFARAAGVECRPVVGEGELHEVLRTAADPTDLICAGFAGRFSGTRIGSQATRLLRSGPCPVLLAAGPMRDLNRIVAAFDGTGPCEHALKWSAELSEQTGWPLVIVASQGPRSSVEDSLERAQQLAPEGAVVHYGRVGESEPSQMQEAATHARGGLIVLGTSEGHWLRRLIVGDPGLKLAAQLEAPVVFVH